MKAREYKLPRPYTELGAYLHESRKRAGVTQREISDELNYSSAQFISNFERGISSPPVKKLKHLVKRLRLDKTKAIRLLLAGEEQKILSSFNS